MYQVKFADIGEGLTEGTVAQVLVKVGDVVKAGQPLYFVETDKVNSEIPAPIDGKIAVINIKAGQEIKVGEVVMEIEDGASAEACPKDGACSSSKKEAKSEPVEENASVIGATPVSNELLVRNIPKTTSSSQQAVKATPLARKIADDLNIDLSTIQGSGPNGIILVADVKESQPSVQEQPAPVQEQPAPVQEQPAPVQEQPAPIKRLLDIDAPLS